MDYSQLSTDDLQALQGGDISKVSSAGLKALYHGQTADKINSDPISQGARDFATNGAPSSVSSKIGQFLGSIAPGMGPLSGATSALGTLVGDPGNAAAGVGSGMTSVGRAIGLGGVAGSYGLPATKADAASLDAPLLGTAAGQMGNTIGKASLVAPTAFIPGANTLVGAGLIGAATGAATTEGGVQDRLEGAALQGAGGAFGVAGGKVIAAGASKLAQMRADRIAAAAAAAGGRPAAAQAATAAGYVLPPTEINPSMLNSALEGFSGKIKTSQSASQTNQPVTNKLAQQALGLPTDRQITPDALINLRKTAGNDYQALGSTGTVVPDSSYGDALDQIVAPYTQAARSFPSGPASPVIDQINALRTPQFDAGDALAKISTLRDAAETAYGQQNKSVGKSLKQAANALEDALDSHVSTLQNAADEFVSSGQAQPGTFPDYGSMLDKFRGARQQIAKSYSVQGALNPQTGDVSAPKLAAAMAKGAPLSNELATIAQTAQAFPRATQALGQNYNALSPLDYAGAVIAGTAGTPLAATSIALRPAIRSAILSPTYQKMTTPSAPSAQNLLLQMLQTPQQIGLSRLGGMSVGAANQPTN